MRRRVRADLAPRHPARPVHRLIARQGDQVPTFPSSTVEQARKAIAARLTEMRRDAGLTKRALAQAAGWHPSKATRIENGATRPSDADIRAWCRICNADDQAADLI